MADLGIAVSHALGGVIVLARVPAELSAHPYVLYVMDVKEFKQVNLYRSDKVDPLTVVDEVRVALI